LPRDLAFQESRLTNDVLFPLNGKAVSLAKNEIERESQTLYLEMYREHERADPENFGIIPVGARR